MRLSACRAVVRPLATRRYSSSAASSSTSWRSLGKNSCIGGSRSRTVTGLGARILNITSKSERCIGNSSSSAANRSSRLLARIISTTTGSRSVALNIRSVLQSPIPLAPYLRASAAISGVSPLASTLSLDFSSAHSSRVLSSGENSAGRLGISPA